MQQPSARPSKTWRVAAWGLSLAAVAGAAVALVFLWPTHQPAAVPAGGGATQTAATATIPRTGISQPEVIVEQREHVDPRFDGWDSETFAELADGQLKLLGKLLAHPDEINEQHLAPLVVEEFTSAGLRPPLQQQYSDACLTVYRPPGEEDGDGDDAPQDAAAALRGLAAPFEGAADVRVKFKIIRVHLGEAPDAETRTVAYYHAAGRFDRGTVEQTSTWHCRWAPAEGDAPPRLASIGVTDYEEVVNRAGVGKWFADCTEAVLAHNASYRQQLSYGIDHWRARVDSVIGPYPSAHHGLAVADVNGDGLEDLYVCQPGGLPNRLYVQNPDGTARDFSVESGLDWLDGSSSAVFLDLDNDGDQDLLLAVTWGVLPLANDGRGHFKPQTPWQMPSPPGSITVADYDQDGDLDFYVCAYGAGGIGTKGDEIPFPYHNANNGGRNRLAENQGNWEFRDVTAQVGLDENNTRWTFAAAWEDYDNDGDLDLYVANDNGHNNLYQFDAKTKRFKDVAAAAGVLDQASGMSVSWGDYDGDGWMDVYISNMFSAAGNRITSQERFLPGASPEAIRGFRRHARGNTLFKNMGDGTFRDVSQEAAVTMGRWAWASTFVDLNNDGREDLFVSNGFVTQEDPGDL